MQLGGPVEIVAILSIDPETHEIIATWRDHSKHSQPPPTPHCHTGFPRPSRQELGPVTLAGQPQSPWLERQNDVKNCLCQHRSDSLSQHGNCILNPTAKCVSSLDSWSCYFVSSVFCDFVPKVLFHPLLLMCWYWFPFNYDSPVWSVQQTTPHEPPGMNWVFANMFPSISTCRSFYNYNPL